MKWWYFPVVGAVFTLAAGRLVLRSKAGALDRAGWTVLMLAVGLACFIAGNLWMFWD